MTLAEILEALPALTPDKFAQLKEQVQWLDSTRSLRAGTVNVDVLLSAIREMKEGMDNQQVKEMVDAMNSEYVEHGSEPDLGGRLTWGEGVASLIEGLDMSDWQSQSTEDPLEWVKYVRQSN